MSVIIWFQVFSEAWIFDKFLFQMVFNIYV
jgi:hypothetical protein